LKQHLLLVGRGGRFPELLHNHPGVEVRTSVICRAQTLSRVSVPEAHEMLIGVRPDQPSSTWIKAARTIHDQLAVTGIGAFGELDQDHASYIAEALGLEWHKPETVHRVANKLAMRRCLFDAGLDDTPCALIQSMDELKRMASHASGPIIVKPVDGTASVGVSCVVGADEAAAAWARASATNAWSSGGVIAETFLAGPQFSVECFGVDGQHSVVGTTRKYSDPQSFVELGHVSPGMTDELQRTIGAYVISALKALGVTFGPTHTEVVLTKNGPRIIETHIRVAGDEIPQLVADVTGVDLEQATVAQALGEGVLSEGTLAHGVPQAQASAIWYVAADTEGRLQELRGMDEAARAPGVVGATSDVALGDQVHRLRSSRDRCGWVRCRYCGQHA
jgi:biotin carboxylase